MDNKAFYRSNITLFGLGFTMALPSGGTKQLYASFFYAHHGGAVTEINAELVKRGLRPMTREELNGFFKSQALSLSSAAHVNLLATAPENIRPHDDEKNRSLVPGIWTEDGVLKCGTVIVANYGDGIAFINDHTWTVLAIDESKTILTKGVE